MPDQVLPAMPLVYHPAVLLHDTGKHPENAQRIHAIGPVSKADVLNGAPYLPLVHTDRHIRTVQEASASGQPLDGDTVTSKGSFRAACFAVGAAITASDCGGFAVVRPPGHHAYADRAAGFCLFNSIAVATQRLVEQGKRVAIIDFDGHMGDGTVDIFEGTDQVLVWSLHQYPAYPGHGFVHEIGTGKGKGFTINTPLPPGSADDILHSAIDHYLTVIHQFQPDVVALSAGFDAHQGDLILDLKASTTFYYELAQKLRGRFDNIFAVLEGGYSVTDLPRCLHNFIAGMNNQPIPHPEPPTRSSKQAWETYQVYSRAATGHLSPYWSF